MADRVLVPYDGSTPSNDALEYAFETYPDAEVTALHVIEVPESRIDVLEGPELRPPLTEKAREYAMELLEGATALADTHDRDLETAVVTGKPDRRIVEYATKHGHDAIVIGSHGRSGVSRVLLGSVAADVVRRAPIPVAVVR
ncbi:universal stress protein [Natronorubrum aibiense]|uniref:Universal stress protein n=1 Tax=Natronorubrum aibiense TaxID=348826 RepID=A0A5P9P4U5_9EURY|nr:universal stress protein [Natronorubrum aibiense]QFU83096.1 universal stress protein [Natronorubrum aibiense]